MPKQPNWPPRVTVHKARNLDRVKWGGRYYYLGKAGSEVSRKAYADLLTRITGDPRPVPPARGGLLVAELVELWLAHAESRYSEAGKEASQFRFALGPLATARGGLEAAKFAAADLEAVRDEMIRRGWSRRVINRRVVRIRTMWRWAERRGHAPAGSWAALRALEPLGASDKRAPDLPARKPCEWPALAKVCRQCPPAVRDLLLCQWFTAMRPGEARQMRAGEIDRSAEPWVYRPATHKNAWRGQPREVVIGPRCRKILERRLAGLTPGDHVFPAGPGRCYTSESYSRAVARACVKAGVKLSAYSCRHAAKQRAVREMSLDHARSYLGQKSLDATNAYAAGPDMKMAADVARKLG